MIASSSLMHVYNQSSIHTNKTCFLKPGLTKWKLATEIKAEPLALTKAVVDKNPKATLGRKKLNWV